MRALSLVSFSLAAAVLVFFISLTFGSPIKPEAVQDEKSEAVTEVADVEGRVAEQDAMTTVANDVGLRAEDEMVTVVPVTVRSRQGIEDFLEGQPDEDEEDEDEEDATEASVKEKVRVPSIPPGSLKDSTIQAEFNIASQFLTPDKKENETVKTPVEANTEDSESDEEDEEDEEDDGEHVRDTDDITRDELPVTEKAAVEEEAQADLGLHVVPKVPDVQNEITENLVEGQVVKKAGQESMIEPIDAVKSVVDPVESAADPVESAADTVKSAVDPVKSAVDPVKSAVDPVKSAVDPVKSAVDPVKSAVDPVKSAVDPVVEKAADGAPSENKMAAESTNQVQGEARASCECGRLPFKIPVSKNSGINEYPWTVAIVRGGLFAGGRPHCAGTLINDLYVLTSATCVDSLEALGLQVWLTAHDSFEYHGVTFGTIKASAVEIKMHPNYNRDTKDNDIALIKLSSPIDVSGTSYFVPACLPAIGSTYAGRMGVTAAWSQQNVNKFCKGNIPVLDNRVCNRDTSHSGKITDNMFCAGFLTPTRDLECIGDSGGPLVVPNQGRHTLIGIVSWSFESGKQSTHYSPTVYTRVSGYSDWILHNTADADWCSG